MVRSASRIAELPCGKMRVAHSLIFDDDMRLGYLHTHQSSHLSSLWAILVHGLHHVVEKIGVPTLGLSLFRGRTFQTKTFFLLLLRRLHSLLLLFDGGQSLLLDF